MGFGFGADDEHINGIIRTLLREDNKEVEIVTRRSTKTDDDLAKEYASKLKLSDWSNISIIQVNDDGKDDEGRAWTEII